MFPIHLALAYGFTASCMVISFVLLLKEDKKPQPKPKKIEPLYTWDDVRTRD